MGFGRWTFDGIDKHFQEKESKRQVKRPIHCAYLSFVEWNSQRKCGGGKKRICEINFLFCCCGSAMGKKSDQYWTCPKCQKRLKLYQKLRGRLYYGRQPGLEHRENSRTGNGLLGADFQASQVRISLPGCDARRRECTRTV